MKLVEQGTFGDLPYAIIKTDMGSLCGYLGVPQSHPWYGQDYDNVDAEVHGGLTFSESSYYGKPQEVERLKRKHENIVKWESSISLYQRLLDRELEQQGKPRNYPIETELDVWWFGFDCAHYMDLVPGMEKYTVINKRATYKDRNFVYNELEKLAEQAYTVMSQSIKDNPIRVSE